MGQGKILSRGDMWQSLGAFCCGGHDPVKGLLLVSRD